MVLTTYPEAIYGAKPVGRRVAGSVPAGIGFDVGELLVTDESPTLNLKDWEGRMGVADPQEARRLVRPIPCPTRSRGCTCYQRTQGPRADGLGKTGWSAPGLTES